MSKSKLNRHQRESFLHENGFSPVTDRGKGSHTKYVDAQGNSLIVPGDPAQGTWAQIEKDVHKYVKARCANAALFAAQNENRLKREFSLKAKKTKRAITREYKATNDRKVFEQTIADKKLITVLRDTYRKQELLH